jgi:ubiquinone/menaquinone biosynthesis C-methylase UbiE
MNSTLEKNKRYAEGFHQKVSLVNVPDLLIPVLSEINSLVDLGAGEGDLLYSLDHSYKIKTLSGIDISPRRVTKLKKRLPNGEFFARDVLHSKFKSSSFDLVLSTQVIEHIDDPRQLVTEIKRMLKKEGFAYVTSVVKKRGAIYKYFNQGKFVLDPPHVSEFPTFKSFYNLFIKEGFSIVSKKEFPVKRKLFGLAIRIPRFYIVEVLVRKK